MKIFVASDHAGFELKESVAEILKSMGHQVVNLGPYDNNRVDYPDFANLLCGEVLKEEGSLGVLVCGSGIGRIESLIIERGKSIFNFNRDGDTKILWKDITKIGEDVILVNVTLK